MRGSQWEGAGKGPGIGLERVLVVVGLFVLLSVAVVYYYQNQPAPAEGSEVTNITTTGVGCQGALPFQAQAVENDPRFPALDGGYCYNFMGESSAGVLTFDHYNGTVDYRCGTTAYDVVAGQIEANLTSTGAVGSIWAESQGLNPAPACPSTPPVSVVSVVFAGSLIPAVPELTITLEARGGNNVTSLKAILDLSGSAQEFVFVSSPATLHSGVQASKSQIVSSNAPLSSVVLYPMTVSGTLADGQAFTSQAYVQIVGIPAA